MGFMKKTRRTPIYANFADTLGLEIVGGRLLARLSSTTSSTI